MGVEPVLGQGRQVLIAAQVRGEALADALDRATPTGLGPTVGVQIGDQVVEVLAVVRRQPGEGRLGQDELDVVSVPATGPGFEEKIDALIEEFNAKTGLLKTL